MTRTQEACDLLARIAGAYPRAALANSLAAEDMVLTDMIARHRIAIDIFILDTGRLHGDTLGLVAEIKRRYGLKVQVVTPEPRAVEAYVSRFGRDAFYESVALRKRCCEIRKVEPLQRALAGRKAWITGMRRAQAETRAALALEEYDAVHGMAKFNPLADWSEADVWSYIRGFGVPANPLYEQGYRSIGCAPCTRPVVAGENARAGRWWWETGSASECGMHFAPDGRTVRKKAVAA